MGLALPGKFPAEFSTDSSLYARWFGQIGEMNANTLRIYTILPPAFYRALRAHNLARPAAPLYVIHGVWTELPPGDDFDDPEFNAEYQLRDRARGGPAARRRAHRAAPGPRQRHATTPTCRRG